jgi:hypothetical protein
MGFKDYKIRDGVHIPSDKFRKNWDKIFGKDKTKEELPKEEEDYIKELEEKL